MEDDKRSVVDSRVCPNRRKFYWRGRTSMLNQVKGVRLLGIMIVGVTPFPAAADNLYPPEGRPSLSSDLRASRAGDIVTVVVVQAAEASTSMQNNSRRSSQVEGSVGVGSIDERAELGFGSSYSGRGEVRRAERFVTQMTVTVIEVLANGDLVIGGQQAMKINGEDTLVSVRGRVRAIDVDAENRIASNRIADAQIDYNGSGFVSRSARPGLINRIFSFLGLN